MKRKLFWLVILVVAASLLAYVYYTKRYQAPREPVNAGVPSEQPTPPTPISTTKVIIQNFSFDPATVNIKVGERILWENRDSVPHTVTGAGLASPSLSQSESFNYTFSQAGTYDYYCSIHPSMKGKVIVE